MNFASRTTMHTGRRCFLRALSGWPLVSAGMGVLPGCVADVSTTTASVPVVSSAGTGASQRLLDGFIRPAVQRFARAAAAMQQSLLQSACLFPDTSPRKAFRELVLAWSALELLRFGPLVQDNRFERIFFWPDPRGVMLRQMRPLLQAVENVPQDIRTHSVALQGLPALEYLLYTDVGGNTENGGYAARCALALAIARNLADIAGRLQQAWDGTYAQDFAAPAGNNAIYRNEKEAVAEIIKALSAGLRFEGEVKLRAALGTQQDKVRPRLLPFWRSGLSLLALAEAVQALRAWHVGAGFSEPAWLAENLERELQESAALLQQHHTQATHMAQDEEVYQALRLIVLKLDNARRLVDENLASAQGVALGFNALDGD